MKHWLKCLPHYSTKPTFLYVPACTGAGAGASPYARLVPLSHIPAACSSYQVLTQWACRLHETYAVVQYWARACSALLAALPDTSRLFVGPCFFHLTRRLGFLCEHPLTLHLASRGSYHPHCACASTNLCSSYSDHFLKKVITRHQSRRQTYAKHD